MTSSQRPGWGDRKGHFWPKNEVNIEMARCLSKKGAWFVVACRALFRVQSAVFCTLRHPPIDLEFGRRAADARFEGLD